MSSNLYIVIAAYNEEKTILQTIRDIQSLGHNIIVIDDCSSDKTKNILKKLDIQLLENKANQGYDISITKVIKIAFVQGAENVVTCDADGQHTSKDIAKLINIIMHPEIDFASGIRDKFNRPIEKLIGKISYYLYQNKDPFCGLKGYSRNFYNCFSEFPKSLNLGTLPLSTVKKNHLSYKLVDITIKKRHDESRFGNSLKANLILLFSFIRTLFVS